MKKIILAALTVLMMFAFVGCSGTLHDYVDPPPAGYWFYVDVGADTTSLILNEAGGQTSDMTIDVSAGSVYYNYTGGSGCTVFEGANKPASQIGRVWIVSTLENFNAYYWGGTQKTDWPGDAVTKSEFVLEN